MNSTNEKTNWGSGYENQRQADLGDGTYLNPILAGDHADPSILKDGDDYYLVCSSFFRYPGLLIWHSKDLVNWEPIKAALHQNVGSVWAPDIVRHNGRYYIYFPGLKIGYLSNYVIWADSIDGQRYLFMSGGHRIELSEDGLSAVGEMEKVYDGWKYPDDWIVEGFAQEGPKMLKRCDYYYMVLAEGGTPGPPTRHMVVVARSKSIDGPWENSPYNPVVRTWSRDEKWCSKGHATLVEGPDGQWHLVYHAYENGFYTLGRHTLLEPVVWTEDGWFKSAGYDTAQPIPKPAGGQSVRHGLPFSDDFTTNKIGVQWSFHEEFDPARYCYENGSLVIQGKGESPKDCSPLTFDAGDQAYQIEVGIEVSDGATAGLILFYNQKLYGGLGFNKDRLIMHRYGLEANGSHIKADWGHRLWLRLVNDRHIVSLFYSMEGQNWKSFGRSLEVSGYHQNVAGEFLSLRPAIYAAGQGEVRFSNFRYQKLS